MLGQPLISRAGISKGPPLIPHAVPCPSQPSEEGGVSIAQPVAQNLKLLEGARPVFRGKIKIDKGQSHLEALRVLIKVERERLAGNAGLAQHRQRLGQP